MPTDREWRQYDRDHADRELVDRAADWLFDGHDRRKTAGRGILPPPLRRTLPAARKTRRCASRA